MYSKFRDYPQWCYLHLTKVAIWSYISFSCFLIYIIYIFVFWSKIMWWIFFFLLPELFSSFVDEGFGKYVIAAYKYHNKHVKNSPQFLVGMWYYLNRMLVEDMKRKICSLNKTTFNRNLHRWTTEWMCTNHKSSADHRLRNSELMLLNIQVLLVIVSLKNVISLIYGLLN